MNIKILTAFGVGALLALGIVNAADSDAVYQAVTDCYENNSSGLCQFLSVDSSGTGTRVNDQISSGGTINILEDGYRISSDPEDRDFDGGGSVSGSDDTLDNAVEEPEKRLDVPVSEMLQTYSFQAANGSNYFGKVLDILEQSYVGDAVKSSGAGYVVGIKIRGQIPVKLRNYQYFRDKDGVFSDYETKWRASRFRHQLVVRSSSLPVPSGRIDNTDKYPDFNITITARSHNWSDYWEPSRPELVSSTPKCTFNYANKSGNAFDGSGYYDISGSGNYTLEFVCVASVDLYDVFLQNDTSLDKYHFGSYVWTSHKWPSNGVFASKNCPFEITAPKGVKNYFEGRCNDSTFNTGVQWLQGNKVNLDVEVWGYTN